MFTFIASVLLLLLLGYFIYGRIIEKYFAANSNIKTPVNRLEDGIDYIKLPTWKVFMIQLLNIAGLGPIFGAVLGAMYGPVAYIWIVFGSIFMGAVHDYFSGMISIRNDGKSLSEATGLYMGKSFMQFSRVLSFLVLIFVGAAFVNGPAALLTKFTGGTLGLYGWIIIIFAYYMFATLLPIDKIIGKIYPIFGLTNLTKCLDDGSKPFCLALCNCHPSF